MPPYASTSTMKLTGGVKLSALEAKLHKIGLTQKDKRWTQSEICMAASVSESQDSAGALNALLRTNLAKLYTEDNQLLFQMVTKDEAKTLGAMDSEEKLVFDQIKEAGNQGIWTKTINTRTGLPRVSVTKVLKGLEARKMIKSVKSVKTPTRKMYMLYNLSPSVEITGGPWFTDNELDTDFVDALQKVVLVYLREHSIPNAKIDPVTKKLLKPRQIFPTCITPTLPTVKDIRDFIISKEVASVELTNEHVEALLDLMVYDGTIEKVFLHQENMVEAKKRKLDDLQSDDLDESSSDEPIDDYTDTPRRKIRKVNGGNGGRKKVASKYNGKVESDTEDGGKSGESEVSDSDDDKAKRKTKKPIVKEEEDDVDMDVFRSPTRKGKQPKRRRKDRTKKAPIVAEEDDSATSESSRANSDDEGAKAKRRKAQAKKAKRDMQDASDNNGCVYRLIQPYQPLVGWMDMPCGNCETEAFCTEPSRPLGPHHKRKSAASYLGLTRGRQLLGRPRIQVGGMQGVGMIGGAGAAIGTSNERWGETNGAVGDDIAPVNPKDCVYFPDWLSF